MGPQRSRKIWKSWHFLVWFRKNKWNPWNRYLIVGFRERGSGSSTSLLSLFGQTLVVAGGGLNIPPWKRGHFSVLSRKFSRNFNFWAYLWRNNRQWQPREEHPIWWKGKSLRPREDWSLLLEGGRRRCWWWLARRPEKLGKNTSNSNQIFTRITQNSYLVFFSVICHCLLLLVGDLVGILVDSKKIKL